MKYLVFLIIILVSCGPSKQAQLKAKMDADFKFAASVNTEKLYKEFILKYPTSSYVPEVKTRLLELEELNAYNDAIKQNKIEAIDNFLIAYPNSKHKYNALNKRTALEKEINVVAENRKREESAWAVAQSDGSISAYQIFIKNYPYSRFSIEAQQQIDRFKRHNAIEEREEKRRQDLVYEAQQQKQNEAEDKLWGQTVKLNTIGAYKKYLNAYPDGRYSEQATEQIIVKEVDAIQKAPHGKLTAPQAIRGFSKIIANCEIEITNDTKYTLTVWYDGPSKKKIVLNTGDSYDIVLIPGYYRVAASVNTTSVRPFAGNYTLNAGGFSEKFYIKTTRY